MCRQTHLNAKVIAWHSISNEFAGSHKTMTKTCEDMWHKTSSAHCSHISALKTGCQRFVNHCHQSITIDRQNITKRQIRSTRPINKANTLIRGIAATHSAAHNQPPVQTHRLLYTEACCLDFQTKEILLHSIRRYFVIYSSAVSSPQSKLEH